MYIKRCKELLSVRDLAKPKDVESITIKPDTIAWVRLLNYAAGLR